MTQKQNIPIGYKREDLGLLPQNWNTISIGESTIKVGSGVTPKGGSKVYKQTGRPFIRSQNIGWGHLKIDDLVFIDEETHQSFSSTEIMENDVLLNITGASIGRSAVSTYKLVGGNVNQHVCIIRPMKEKLVSRYLNYFLLSHKGQSQIESFQAGGNRQGLNFHQIRSIQIAIPETLKEQKTISSSIFNIDSLITNLAKLIKKKCNIKQGVMQELLTGKRRLPTFNGKWKIMSIRSLLQTPVTDGPHLTPKFVNSGIPFLSVNNLVNNKIDLTDLRHITLSDHLEFSKKCRPQRGDILMGKAASVGAVALVDIDLEFNIWSPLALLRFNQIHDPKYMYYALQTRTVFDQIKLLTNSSSQGNLGMGDIKKIELNTPPKEEQTAIAEVLSDMDAEIEALESQKAKYIDLKQGMMQKLLTGKIRLV